MSFSNGNGTEIVISTPLRTAIGTFGGSLKDVSAVDLGTTVAKEVISRSGIDAEQIDQVIVGNVLMAGQGMNPGRQVGINAGVPQESPAMTINRMCASGLQAIVSAAQEIALGESDVILAGGIENMDMAPFLLPKGRYGYRMGLPEAKMGLLDHMVYDGLWDKFNDYHMGVTAENVAEQYGLSRDEVDEYSARSHQRAEQSRDEGYFDDQIVPVEIKQKKETVQYTADEHIRENASVEGLGKLKPVFKKDGGTVTAGNASGINDGAAATVVMSADKAREFGVTPLGRVVSYASAGVEPRIMGMGPVPAIRRALQKADMTVEDIDLFEVNEAFAAQSCAVVKELKLPAEKTNVHGGAIALGHPIGASGARVLTTLLYAMQRHNAKRGLVSLCIGGGQGIAMVVSNGR